MKSNFVGLFICFFGLLLTTNVFIAGESENISQEELKITCKVLRFAINQAIKDEKNADATICAVALNSLIKFQNDSSQFEDCNRYVKLFFDLNKDKGVKYIVSLNKSPLKINPNNGGNNGGGYYHSEDPEYIEIKIVDHKAKSWYNKGVVLYILGRDKEALEAFNNAIEIK
jgi:tetratricopeptide (TPR) repeat protein